MQIRPLSIAGAWEVLPQQFGDDRGSFLEVFSGPTFAEAVGHPLTLGQVNTSISRAGVVRGIHFADVPPGQAKYVSCSYGAVLDVVIDIRVGSPTFGQWEGVVLDDVDRRAIYICEGLGHAFMALADDSTVTYLCSTPYAPGREHGIHPLDPAVGITWPTTGRDGSPLEKILSPKDAQAPTLAEARASGLLPDAAACTEWIAALA